LAKAPLPVSSSSSLSSRPTGRKQSRPSTARAPRHLRETWRETLPPFLREGMQLHLSMPWRLSFSGQSVSKRTKARGLFGRLINKKAFSGTGRPPRSDDEEELVDGALRVTIRHAPAIRSTDPFGWIHGEANPKHCQTDLLHRKAGAGTCFRSGKVEARPGRRSPQRFHGMGACAAPIPPNKQMGTRRLLLHSSICSHCRPRSQLIPSHGRHPVEPWRPPHLPSSSSSSSSSSSNRP
jgi:hypothetical protein